MICNNCGKEYTKEFGQIEFKSKILGKILIPDISYYECKDCGEKLLNSKMSDKVDKVVAKEEQKAIGDLPICDFITAKDAAKILGITKQAFSKHHKIKKGLIYSVKIGNRKYYHRKSVEMFSDKDNGKFLIDNTNLKEYILSDSSKILSKYQKIDELFYNVFDNIIRKQKDIKKIDPIAQNLISKAKWKIDSAPQKMKSYDPVDAWKGLLL